MNDKLLGIALVILAIVMLPLLDGDGTFLVFSICLALLLIFKDVKFPGGFVEKTRSIMKNIKKEVKSYDK